MNLLRITDSTSSQTDTMASVHMAPIQKMSFHFRLPSSHTVACMDCTTLDRKLRRITASTSSQTDTMASVHMAPIQKMSFHFRLPSSHTVACMDCTTLVDPTARAVRAPYR